MKILQAPWSREVEKVVQGLSKGFAGELGVTVLCRQPRGRDARWGS